MTSIVIIALFGLLYFTLSKNTPLEISFRHGKLAGALYFIQIFVYILAGSVFYYNGTYNKYSTTFFVTPENARTTTYAIWYASFVFLIVFAFFTKNKYHLSSHVNSSPAERRKIKTLLYLTELCLVATVIVFYAFGMRNALILSFFTGSDLIVTRLSNFYSGIPTVAISYFLFLLHFFAILLGTLFKTFSRSRKLFYIIFLLYMISWLGNKSLYLYVFFELYIAYLCSGSRLVHARSNDRGIRRYVSLGIILSVIVSLFLIIAYAQIGFHNVTDLVDYLIYRGLMGEIFGAYEALGLGVHHYYYILTSIPFANFFFDQQYFNKDLMMATWGARFLNPHDTGVVNSFFIGEAFAMGGYVLMFLSPFITAIAFFLGHGIFTTTFQKLFGISRQNSRNLAVLMVVSTYWLTNDFNGFLFMKLGVMQWLFLLSILVVHKILIHPRNMRIMLAGHVASTEALSSGRLRAP